MHKKTSEKLLYSLESKIFAKSSMNSENKKCGKEGKTIIRKKIKPLTKKLKRM